MSQSSPLNAYTIGDTAGFYRRPRFLSRRRYQLGLGVLLAVILPALANPLTSLSSPAITGAELTTLGTFAGVIFGAFLLWRMGSFPGATTTGITLPAFTASYAAIVFVFFFTRFDYSRLQFIESYFASVLWFGLIGYLQPRLRRASLLLVPFGRADNLLTSTQADWHTIQSPTDLPPGISGVVADLRADLPSDWQHLLAKAALQGLPVYHWKQVAESLSGSVDIEHLSENVLGSLLPSSVYFRFKRLFDVLIAIAVLPAALLILAAAGLAILLTDGGPVFFRQERMGFRGQPFVMLKLRTMGDGLVGAAFTTDADPRVTKVGRWLRRYRIDEVPQIFNILRGEMSWIGPRPESLELAAWYEREVAFYSYRHILRPGITGWAQINQGNVAEVKAATGKLRYDFYYIKYFSPWLDVLIAVRTIKTVLTGFGSR